VTSFRQIEANRRNALRSTGPVTEAGKRRSRRNAVRHGLTAETVVETLEDIEDYRGFEAAVIAGYDARNAVERELVLRLASLLWRIRRATAIETELLRIQAEILRGVEIRKNTGWSTDSPSTELFTKPSAEDIDEGPHGTWDWPSRQSIRPARDLAYCFLRLVDIDSGVFERLGRYECALSRQIFRTLNLLKATTIR
jgi:hypothetical protein